MIGQSMRFLLLGGALVLLGLFVCGDSRAQDGVPDLPLPLQTMATQGAQIRYLGRELGFDGWLAIHKGTEQFFYATPDGEALFMGLLFNREGKAVTMRQIAELRGAADMELLDMLSEKPAVEAPDVSVSQKAAATSPAEQLFEAVRFSNWFPIGKAGAAEIYMIMDPNCPHCKAFLSDLRKPYIESGKIQVRVIPVGLNPESLAQAAFLLSAPDSEGRLFRYLDGEAGAIPARNDISDHGVQRNLSIMQAWKLTETPMTIYRSGSGDIRIVRGRAQDIHALYQDLL